MKEADGYKLFLSSGNATGYKGVYKQTNGKFIAQYTDTALNKLMYIGIYDTAVEAAVAYAKQMAAKSIYPNGGVAPSAATPAPVLQQ